MFTEMRNWLKIIVPDKYDTSNAGISNYVSATMIDDIL